MKKYKSPLHLSGSDDDRTYYIRDGKTFWRNKTSLNAEQFETDPRFANSRTARDAFDHGIKLGTALRAVLRPYYKGFTDSKLSGRMNGRFQNILHPRKPTDQGPDFDPFTADQDLLFPAEEKAPDPHTPAAPQKPLLLPLRAVAHAMVPFKFDAKRTVTTLVSGPLDWEVVHNPGPALQIDVPPIDPPSGKLKQVGATHARSSIILVSLIPKDPAKPNALPRPLVSAAPWLPLENHPAHTHTIPIVHPSPDQPTYLVILAIQTAEVAAAGRVYPFQTIKAMEIVGMV